MILETNVSRGKESVSIPELHRYVWLRKSPLWLCGGWHGRFGHSFSVGKRIFDDIAKERKGAFVWTVFLCEWPPRGVRGGRRFFSSILTRWSWIWGHFHTCMQFLIFIWQGASAYPIDIGRRVRPTEWKRRGLFSTLLFLFWFSLKLLFDKHALKATSIVDSGGVSCFVGQKTGRKVYQVKGHKSGDTYTVFPDHYCSCHSFFYDIATKSEGIYVCVWWMSWLGCGRMADIWVLSCVCSVSIRLLSTCRMHWTKQGSKQFKI